MKFIDSRDDDRNPYCVAFGWFIIAAPIILAALGIALTLIYWS